MRGAVTFVVEYREAGELEFERDACELDTEEAVRVRAAYLHSPLYPNVVETRVVKIERIETVLP